MFIAENPSPSVIAKTEETSSKENEMGTEVPLIAAAVIDTSKKEVKEKINSSIAEAKALLDATN